MLVSAYYSPFQKVIGHLDNSEAHYVFAGYFTDEGEVRKVRYSGGDLLTAMLLLGKTFGYAHVFFACEIELLWNRSYHAEDFETQLATAVAELAEEIDDLEFALLWTPPGNWNPRVAHSNQWNVDRVRDELFLTMRSGLKSVHEEVTELETPAIANMSTASAGNLVLRGWGS